MPRITFAPTASSYIEVSDETVKDVEDTYNFLRQNDGQKAFAEFDTKEEKLSWTRQVRAYTATREAGALSFRILPDKAKALNSDLQMYFRITADLPANGSRGEGRQS
jgi:hypothetical protein